MFGDPNTYSQGIWKTRVNIYAPVATCLFSDRRSLRFAASCAQSCFQSKVAIEVGHDFGPYNVDTPRKFNVWNLKNDPVEKESHLPSTSIFGIHVNFFGGGEDPKKKDHSWGMFN